MRITGALWVWVQFYGTKVLLGEQSGGQRDIRLGKRVRLQLGHFFRGTDARSRGRRFVFTAETYAEMPRWRFTLATNPEEGARANEVRLVRQDPRSREAYPLWAQVINRLPSRVRPRQAIVFVRDTNNRIHVRCVDNESLRSLPRRLVHAMRASRSGRRAAPAGVWISSRPAGIRPTLSIELPRTIAGRRVSWLDRRPNAGELMRRATLGEAHVLKALRQRYPEPEYLVEHVAAVDPSSSYDIRVLRTGNRSLVLYAEVKATVGTVGSPVEISEREMRLRRQNRRRHRIFIVYLGRGGALPPSGVIEIRSDDQFVLSPRRYMLWPNGRGG